jgi:hypothetical protein
MAKTNLLLIILFLTLATAPGVQAASSAGYIHALKGRATATTTEGDVRRLRKGSELNGGEIVSTASASYARLRLADKTWIMLRPDSRFVLDEVTFDEEEETGTGFFSLLKGGFRAVTGLIKKKLNYQFRTTMATIGIRGTSFMVRLCNGDCFDTYPTPANGIYVQVLKGGLVISNNAGTFPFQEGEYAYLANANAPAVALDFPPDVFIQSPIPVADPADCVQ